MNWATCLLSQTTPGAARTSELPYWRSSFGKLKSIRLFFRGCGKLRLNETIPHRSLWGSHEDVRRRNPQPEARATRGRLSEHTSIRQVMSKTRFPSTFAESNQTKSIAHGSARSWGWQNPRISTVHCTIVCSEGGDRSGWVIESEAPPAGTGFRPILLVGANSAWKQGHTHTLATGSEGTHCWL